MSESAVTAAKSLVCTLCEGSYWHGAAVLLNSLSAHGYRGAYHVGYRGVVPAWWASAMRDAPGLGLDVHLHRISPGRHMTNVKPDFLLELLAAAASDVDAAFYFDPDIVNKCTWSFYERWVRCGIALCEDVNSPMDERHPIRQEWRTYYALPPTSGSGLSQYFNGGFIGVAKRDIDFLRSWQRYQDVAAARSVDLTQLSRAGREFIFTMNDQDFLNVAAMTHRDRLAPIGKEGMDFVPGGQLMSHAIGRMKPWATRYLRQVLSGFRPRLVDREYWRRAEAPFRAHAAFEARLARLELACAAALGRVLAR